MSFLSINGQVLLAGINCHMRHLNHEDFDSTQDSDSEWEAERIVEPRALFFNENTIQQTIEEEAKARFRDAARRLMPSRRDGVCRAYKMHPKSFAESFNWDFTNVSTDQQTYYRGGSHYIRPLGSMRYGLDVVDKYEDNAWLGGLGDPESQNKIGSIRGEWPVAYHGTKDPRAAKIVAVEDLIRFVILAFGGTKGKRFAYGQGIYCSPDPETALAYAEPYQHNGRSYRLILQARVNPAHREIVPKSEHGVPGLDDYWLVKKDDAIRPYGICIYPCEEEEYDD